MLDEDKVIKVQELAAKLTPEFLFNYYKTKLMKRIEAGDIGLANEIERLARLEDIIYNKPEPEARAALEDAINDLEMGIPERNKVKRSYTMTPAAREARVKNAQKSTGPRTEAGKRISAANGANANWKYGHCSKSMVKRVLGVCTKKCDKYPCAAVDEKETQAGELCLDREGYLKRVNTLITAARSGKIEDVTEMNLVLLANKQEILDRMMMAVIEDGTVILEDVVNKDGAVVARKFKNHPHIKDINEYMKGLGLDFSAMRMTPQELQKSKDVQDAGKIMAEAFSGASKALARAEELRDDDSST